MQLYSIDNDQNHYNFHERGRGSDSACIHKILSLSITCTSTLEF